ncbi:FAD-dependent oxidoreductase [Lacipirellula parvula]|uniref:NADH dehydrogenase n=1 Tax=Lacipirellula parvula TaxID=2650471 RepID=A0A5K7XQH8_9BACT|nr:FAD-dependent oxidoreductase [Lacipirellula parvula]BBO35899.1 NADH dehydrogenase [Lacipirellula parvula]
MRIVIIGAVAGGASAAARARRLSEQAEIVLIERGEAPSFANCGLPYYVGGVIEQRDKLLVAPAQRLMERFRLDVRTRTEAIAIDRANRTVRLRYLENGDEYDLPYDKLILSPGAAPIRPNIPGVDLPQVFTLRELRDADRLHAAAKDAKRAVVIGGGFIGLEMAENLVHRGMATTIVELADQILPPWDAEMVSPLAAHLREKGVTLKLSNAAEAIEPADNGVVVRLRSGESLEADMVILSVGVRPENHLAVNCGLAVAERGGIKVNDQMQTSDPDIYAVGDAIETRNLVDGTPAQIPLAGPANRQGRIAADHIFGRSTRFAGIQGTAIVGAFEMAAAMTGLSEKVLRKAGTPFEKIYIHPANHAGYYPGAKQMSIKLLFEPDGGRLLGAQAVGRDGVDKRMDVLAVAVKAGMTAFDLEELELAYAPQFGSAKDPVNMAGFVASGVVRGDHPIAHCEDLPQQPGANGELVLDVRMTGEFAAGNIPGAVNIPVDVLRERLGELNREQPIIVYCQVGMRGYIATRILLQNGFNARNLSGGYTTYKQVTAARQNAG